MSDTQELQRATHKPQIETGGLTVSRVTSGQPGYLFSNPHNPTPVFVRSDLIPDILYFLERNHTHKAIDRILLHSAREETFFYLLGKNSQHCNNCQHQWGNAQSERTSCPNCNTASDDIESKLDFGDIEIVSRKSLRKGFVLRQASATGIQISEYDFDVVIDRLAPSFGISARLSEQDHDIASKIGDTADSPTTTRTSKNTSSSDHGHRPHTISTAIGGIVLSIASMLLGWKIWHDTLHYSISLFEAASELTNALFTTGLLVGWSWYAMYLFRSPANKMSFKETHLRVLSLALGATALTIFLLGSSAYKAYIHRGSAYHAIDGISGETVLIGGFATLFLWGIWREHYRQG